MSTEPFNMLSTECSVRVAFAGVGIDVICEVSVLLHNMLLSLSPVSRPGTLQIR